jgi:hypothetical protein
VEQAVLAVLAAEVLAAEVLVHQAAQAYFTYFTDIMRYKMEIT